MAEVGTHQLPPLFSREAVEHWHLPHRLQSFLEEKWQPNNFLLAERTTPTVPKVEKCDLFIQQMQGTVLSIDIYNIDVYNMDIS